MRRCFGPILLWFLCSFSFAEVRAVGTASETDEPAKRVPGQLIIQVSSEKAAPQVADDFAASRLRPARLLSHRLNIWLFEFDTLTTKAALDADRLLDDLHRHPAVELAQFNHAIDLRSTIPNDPFFVNQWGLHNTGQTGGTADADIDAPEAWDLGISGTTVSGDPIVIAVVDAGCDLSHPDIAYFKNIHEIAANGLDDDGNGYIDDYHGWNAGQGNGNVTSSDHGTHVAGIAAAKGNNLSGVCGVNWNVQVMPIVGSTQQEAIAVAAYAYALEMRAQYNETDGASGAFVVATNSSFGVDFGDPADYPIWCALYDSLGAYGVLSAGAAPNIHLDVDVEGDIPTACPSDFLLAVTNTTSSDQLNSSVGYGLESIDLGAPGTSVYSTLQGGGYGAKTGASMASPHVAGAIGYLYSVTDLDLIMLARVRPDSVALLMKQAILGSVDPKPSLTGITVSGGRLNLHQAALAARAIAVGLTILHNPLPDTRDTLNPCPVAATVFSDTALIPDSILLHYEIDGVTTTLSMSPGPGADEYLSSIPAQSPGTVIAYRLTARDVAGQADTSGPHTFRVVDYALALRPDFSASSGLIGDTVWHALWIVNGGLVPDSYGLTAPVSNWPTALYDSSRATQISSTPAIPPGDSLRFTVRVIVPASAYLSTDTASVQAVSVGDPGLSATATRVTVSDGSSMELPFAETFAEIFIDPLFWARAVEMQIDETGLGELSAPYSLHLNGNRFGADTVISTAVDLAGQDAVHFRFAWERTGGGDSPEPGDDLCVDYVDSVGGWQELICISGDGPDMSTFTEEEFSLHQDALHRRFRFRIRCTGNVGPFDDWFVDNIEVALPPPFGVALTPSLSARSGPAGSAVDHPFTLRNRGASLDQFSLQADDLGGWPLQIYDSSGSTPVNLTPLLSPGDSLHLIARVIIASDAAASSINPSRLLAGSQAESGAVDTALIETISDGPSSTLPWFESFPTDTANVLRWFFLGTASISPEAVNPPSGPFALKLDGSVDTVVSQTIDLGSASEVIFTYYYQKGAGEPPDNGDDLWIEYQDNTGQWILLDHLSGDGIAMGRFERRSILLGSDALHSAFRFRLRSFGSCATCDHWFIDNIRLDLAPSLSVQPASIVATLDRGDSLVLKLIVANSGPGALDFSLARAQPAESPQETAADGIGRLGSARHAYPEGFFDIAAEKGLPRTLSGPTAIFSAGGPDEYGYVWVDSDDPSGFGFQWIDIADSGANLAPALSDDNFAGPYPVGFPFPFYDSAYTELYIGSNGIIGFTPDGMDSRANTSLPSGAAPNSLLAWMWSDLDPSDLDNPGVGVHMASDSDHCTIQFTDYPEYGASPGDVITAQVRLFPDGTALFQYLSIAAGFATNTGSVGIEGPDGAAGLEVAYLIPYLHDSLAIQFASPFAWLTPGKDRGEVAPHAADTIDLVVRAAGLDSGVYNLDLIVSSNNPVDPPLTVPVQLTVEVPIAYLCGDINADGTGPNVADLTYLVNFLFRNGPPLSVLVSGDVNNSGGSPNVSDLTYLVAYLFRDGPAPACPPQ